MDRRTADVRTPSQTPDHLLDLKLKRRRLNTAMALHDFDMFTAASVGDQYRDRGLPTYFPGSFAPSFDMFYPSHHSTILPQEPATENPVPRVASSAHINELVAKYSQGGFHAPPSSGLVPHAWLGADQMPDFHLGFGHAADSPPFPAQRPGSQCPWAPPEAMQPVPVLLEHTRVNTHPEGADVSPECSVAGMLFEDLVTWAARHDEVPAAAHERLGCSTLSGAKRRASDMPDVDDLEMGDETRQAVEKWLRDSPEVHEHVLSTDVALAPASEEEQSLPQWVLEELGESKDAAGEARQETAFLARADSHGSSTNGPALWREFETQELSPVASERSEGGGDAPASPEEGSEKFLTPLQSHQLELHVSSMHSSPARDSEEDDDADSAVCHGNHVGMSRSYSTLWIKELLDCSDIFSGDLELPAPEGGHASLPEHDTGDLFGHQLDVDAL